MIINYEETQYGFKYGSADVSRIACDEDKGWVVVGVKSPKSEVQIYITKTGKIRVFDGNGSFEWIHPESL